MYSGSDTLGADIEEWRFAHILHPAQKAEIISFEGQVDILRAGTTEWSPVELKTKLVVGDMIRTSKSSRATLRSADGPDFNVEELTLMVSRAPGHASAQSEKDPDPPPASDRWMEVTKKIIAK